MSFLRIGLLLLPLAIFLQSCGSDELNDKFSAKIDGSDFDILSVEGVKKDSVVFINALGISGNMSILINQALTPGTYTMGVTEMVTATYTTLPSESVYAIPTEGSVTISSHNTTDKTLEGTFNCTIAETNDQTQKVVISEGKFNIVYSEL